MGKSRREKKYIPKPKYNPVVLGKKLEKLSSDLDHHKNLLLSVNKANDLHVEHLSNFVRHDMKNAIQGIDGILYNARHEKLIPDDIQIQLDTALKLLYCSLDNFTNLIPSSNDKTTTLPKVLNAVEMLSRSDLLNKHVDAVFDYDRQSCVIITYPFQSLVQILHNLIINSCNALSDMPEKRILIKGEISTEICHIRIYDNGRNIDPGIREKIFDYGYSTTGGSGIGLFHAKSVLSEMQGTIAVAASNLVDFTKYFLIEFNPQHNSI